MRAVAIRHWFGLLAIKVASARPMPDEQPVTLGVSIELLNWVMGIYSLNQVALDGNLYSLVLTGFILTWGTTSVCLSNYLFLLKSRTDMSVELVA